MHQDQINQAATILADRRANGEEGGRLEASLRPPSLEDGFRLQTEVNRQLIDRYLDEIVGWKCGMPSDEAWVIAPLFKSKGILSAQLPSTPSQTLTRIEPEIAFSLTQDLSGLDSLTPEEIPSLLDKAFLALEIIGTRYEAPKDCTFSELLGDGLYNQGHVLGSEIDLHSAMNLSECSIHTSINGHIAHHDGRHPTLQPIQPILWAIPFLLAKKIPLRKGDFFITGSYAGVIDVPPQSSLTVSFDKLGEISLYR